MIAGVVFPLVVTSEDAQLVADFVGRLDVVTPLLISASRFGSCTTDVPARDQAAEAECSHVRVQCCTEEGGIRIIPSLSDITLILGEASNRESRTTVGHASGNSGVLSDCLGDLLTSATNLVAGRNIEAGVNCDFPGESALGAAVQCQTSFPPCGWDDVLFNRVPLHPVEGVGFVGLVESSHWQQEETCLEVVSSIKCDIDVGLLQLNFTGLAVSSKRVLKLELTVQGDPIAEAVVDEQDPAMEIDLVVGIIVQVQVQLAITTDGGVLEPVAAVVGAAAVEGGVDILVIFRSHLRGRRHDSKAKDEGPGGPPDGSSCHSQFFSLIT